MNFVRAICIALATTLLATSFSPVFGLPRDRPAAQGTYAAPAAIVVAQGERGDLAPRYRSEERYQSSYNDEYVFALTRSVSNSTMHPAAKVPLFLFTVPLDIAVFPIEVLAGFF